LDKQQKAAIIEEHRQKEGDTGSTEIQIALLTARIKQLQLHLTENKHDYHTKRSLLKLIGERRRLSNYMRRRNTEGYKALIQKLGLRK
jgi:small subunit ribosomal protein S15